jgi:hypothetical protein
MRVHRLAAGAFLVGPLACGVAVAQKREFAQGWSLSWEAAFVHCFSNRESAQFEAFDFVVALGKQF